MNEIPVCMIMDIMLGNGVQSFLSEEEQSVERTIYFQKLVIAGDVEEVGASPCMHVLEDNSIFF
jgi:hypothetical protein